MNDIKRKTTFSPRFDQAKVRPIVNNQTSRPSRVAHLKLVDLRTVSKKPKPTFEPEPKVINNINVASLSSFKPQQLKSNPIDQNLINNKVLDIDIPLDFSSDFENSSRISFIPSSHKLPKPSFFKSQASAFKEVFSNLFNSQLLTLKPVPIRSKKQITPFIALVLIATLLAPTFSFIALGFNTKDTVQLRTNASVELLKRSMAKNDVKSIAESLDSMSKGLETSHQEFDNLQGTVFKAASFVPGISTLEDAKKLSRDMAQLSAEAKGVVLALEPFLENKVDPFDKSGQANLVDTIKALKIAIDQAHSTLKTSQQDLAGVNTALLGGNMAQKVDMIKKMLPEMDILLSQTDQYFDIFLKFVGDDYSRQYLFLFQNNQEIRATGGFIGTYGVMKLDKGVVQSLDVNGIYDPDGQLKKNILAPEPLRELTPRWFLRDANWFADFKTSSERILSFYEKTGGPTVDGIVSLTPTVIERLLRITGPIEMPEYGVTITADNFIYTTQYKVEIDYDKKENKPKKFLSELTPKLISQVMRADKSKYGEIVNTIATSVKEKHMLFYFLDPTWEDLLIKNNIAGVLHKTDGDYLSVINSNIGGKKTDGVIEESIHQQVDIMPNGDIMNTVEVTREHKGGDTVYDWWNSPNINYMRFYVPKGSTLVEASGFQKRAAQKDSNIDISAFDKDPALRQVEQSSVIDESTGTTTSEESGKTVFGNWSVIDPKQKGVMTMKYKLPFKFNFNDSSIYSLILQKQSGSIGSRYTIDINYPKNHSLGWTQSSLQLKPIDEDTLNGEGLLRTDQFVGMELK